MSRKADRYHEFYVEDELAPTAKAYHLRLRGCQDPVWVPKSQSDYDRDSATIHISDWLVNQKPELLDIVKGKTDA